jgi:hypothetical protein
MDPNAFIAELEKDGLDQVERKIAVGIYSNLNGKLDLAKAWVAKKQRTDADEAQRKRDVLHAEQAATASRALMAAERAAEAAERQAKTAEKSYENCARSLPPSSV